MQTTPDDVNSDLDRYLERHPLTGGCPYDTTTATHNRHRVELRQHYYAADNNPTWSVCCLTCGAESPPENTYWDAIHVFNSRDDRPLPVVKAAPVIVPIGPEDVPPGSVLRQCGSDQFCADLPEEWVSVVNVDVKSGVIISAITDNNQPLLVIVPWDKLTSCEINRSIPLTGRWDKDAWEKCQKEEATV